MTNPNRDLFDDQVRRRIFLDRHSRARFKQVERFIREVREDIISKLAVARSENREFSVARQKALLANFDDMHREVYSRLKGDLDEGFEELAKAQGIWQADSLKSVDVVGRLNAVSSAQVVAAAKSRPMQGRLLKDWLKDLEPAHRKRIAAQLAISFAEGESLTTAIGRMRDASLKNGRGLEALIRTANTHVASAASASVYEANADIVERYEWRSILDSRTTRVCMGRDGNTYIVGKGPMPPAHIGCRSTTSPVLKDFPPPERETYQEWLARQPESIQNDILGPNLASLFRSGGVSVKDFVDDKGKVLTLAQLGGKTKPSAAIRKKATPKAAKTKITPPPSKYTRGVDVAQQGKPNGPGTPTAANYAKIFDEAFDEAPEWIREAVSVNPAQRMTSAAKGSFYSPLQNNLNLFYRGRNDKTVVPTMRHEYGHSIDTNLAEALGLRRSQQISDELIDASQKDFLALNRINRALAKEGRAFNTRYLSKELIEREIEGNKRLGGAKPSSRFSHIAKQISTDGHAETQRLIAIAIERGDAETLANLAYRQIVGRGSGDAVELLAGEWGQLADFLEAISKTKYGFGHGKSYYNRFNKLGNAYTRGHMAEAFAQYIALNASPRRDLWLPILEALAPEYMAAARSRVQFALDEVKKNGRSK
jgi:SPP1 gp7 family putative phage head morphogenesis protein